MRNIGNPRTYSIIALAAAVAVSGLVGCKKDSEKLTWEETGRPPIVEQHKQNAARLKAPPMFAHIPADTPYVFAAFEPIPASYWKYVCDKLCPVWEKSFAQLARTGSGRSDIPAARVMTAVFEELSGNMSSEGLRKLGISTDPVFAVYGLGPLPVVRLEVADPAALAATLKRIVDKVGTQLPTQRVGNQEYWLAADGSFAAGIVGKELVATVGPRRAVELAIPVLFGGAELPKTMADGAALKKLSAEYGFAPYGLGYFDLRRLAELATGNETGLQKEIFLAYREASSGHARRDRRADEIEDKLDEIEDKLDAIESEAQKPMLDDGGDNDDDDAIMAMPPQEPPAGGGIAVAVGNLDPRGVDSPRCRADLMELTQNLPRLVLGYDEISTKRAIFTAVLETDSATAQRIKSLETKVPGLSERLPGRPMFAIGAALQLEKARTMIDALGQRLTAMGRNCEFDAWIAMGRGLEGILELPMAPSLESLHGGLVVIQKMKFSPAGPPSNISGYAIVGMANAPAALADLRSGMPMLGDVKADGKFHKVPMGPFKQFVNTLRIAAKPDALVLTAGDSAHAVAQKVLGDKSGRSPLLLFAEDIGQVTELTSSIFEAGGGDPTSGALADMMKAQATVFGMAIFAVHATDSGIEMIGRIDLK